MKKQVKIGMAVLLILLVSISTLYVGFFVLFGVGKFCDQPANFKYFDVPGEIMSDAYRNSEMYELNHFLIDGKGYESRAFVQYRLWCMRPDSFEVDDIIAFRDPTSTDVTIGKITEVRKGGYNVLTESGELEIEHSQIIARD